MNISVISQDHGRCALACVAIILAAVWMRIPSALANPVGPSGLQGISNIQGLGTPNVTITQGAPKAILNWQQFNIAPNEVTRFIQPSTSALALNRIWDQNPSQIFGSLQANGSVILLNPNGVLFGPNAQVNVNGLIASSLDLSDQNFLNGRYQFEGVAVNGAVKNAGTITTEKGGFVYLFAPNVENSGVITTPEGHITLAAGTTAYLSERLDGRGFLVEVTAPAGEALNLKDLVADGGRIDLYGQIVNQAGLIQANSVRENNGRIELVAGDRVTLTSGSRTEAKGATEGVSDGGTILALADMSAGHAQTEAGAVIDASGGAGGGNGGFVEVSGHHVDLGGRINVGAVRGYRGGTVLIDPVDVVLNAGMNLANLIFTSPDNDDLRVSGFLELTDTPGQEGTLEFHAGRDLLFNNLLLFNDISGTLGGSKWGLILDARQDIVLTDSWLFSGGGGAVTVRADRDLRLELSDGGTYPPILRAFDGDMHISVGRNLIAPSAAYSILEGSLKTYSGIRVEGTGDLTIDVGGNFVGDGANAGPGFSVANGDATVTVGGSFGAPGLDGLPTKGSYGLVTLGSGDVTITAQGSIYLGRVQDLGLNQPTAVLTADPLNRVDLVSREGDIRLRPQIDLLPGTQTLQEIYPASFSATAEKGSIFFDSKLIRFWPSPTGILAFSAEDGIEGGLFTGLPTRIELVGVALETLKAESLKGGGIGPVLVGVQNRPPSGPYSSVTPVQSVSFKTATGDIQNLEMDFYTPLFPKKVTIESGRDIKGFLALIPAPQGENSVVKAAGTIDMTRLSAAFPDSGLTFVGTGIATVEAGGTLDLGDSRGIVQQVARQPTPDRDQEGLLDIRVGNDLEMARSTIWTYNGAAIQIHGLGDLETPLSGKVNVGTSTTAVGADQRTGIGTQRGGSIDIRADGDVNVNRSRVATFGGGDITINSTNGDINAGSGGRDERINFPLIDSITTDAQGNTRTNFVTVSVPGSGIFTFSADDPNPLPPLPVRDPLRITTDPTLFPMRNTILKQLFLGHDTTALYAAYLPKADPVADREFQVALNGYAAPLKLGDITLDAGRDIVVPVAGIRGRINTLNAGRNIVFEGGQIGGITNVKAQGIQGLSATSGFNGAVSLNNSSFAPANPAGVPPGLSGLSGSTSSLASTATSSTTVAEVVSKGDEAKEQEAASVNSSGDEESAGGKKEKKTRTVRLKRGVTIEVEVKAEKPL